MDGYCVSCGAPVPKGQRTCSMCYGDPDHGKDGYYRREIERQQEQEHERQRSEREWQEQQP